MKTPSDGTDTALAASVPQPPEGMTTGFVADKADFILCLTESSGGVQRLQEVVRSLLRQGVSRRVLVGWAGEAGYSQSHIRNLLNRILREERGPGRTPGAGRKTPREAMALLRLALKHHGDSGLQFLLAAYRAGKAQHAAVPVGTHAALAAVHRSIHFPTTSANPSGLILSQYNRSRAQSPTLAKSPG